MDFVKKHYEKILLGFVLLGLVGALVFLPFMIASDQQKLQRHELWDHPPQSHAAAGAGFGAGDERAGAAAITL